MTENQIATIVVDSALKIHRALGPGLLESVYEVTLAYELNRRGLQALRQQGVPLIYEEIKFKVGFRPDIIIDSKFIVEVKSIEALAPIHRKQTRNLSSTHGHAPRPADQFQRGVNQEWNTAGG
jgi:GxxExxY protein